MIVRYKSSRQATVHLRDHDQSTGVTPKPLYQNVITRWSSAADLLGCFIEMNGIIIMVRVMEKMPPYISELDWVVLEKVRALLEPIRAL